MVGDVGVWVAMSPVEVAGVLVEASFPWWIAGGYAMDHAAGRSIRDHGDIDVLILRRDEAAARRVLAGWDCRASVGGRLVGLAPDAALPLGVHDLWYRETPAGPWRFQVMVDEARGDRLVSRRDARVTRAVADMGVAEGRVWFLAPEIQLYYKAKTVRAKDEVDFAAVLPHLSVAGRAWLLDAIRTSFGDDHPWARRLVEAA